jgi:hypothetical protein
MPYAEGTRVSSDQSRMEIERTLIRYGATEFVSGWSGGGEQQSLAFVIHDRQVRITLPMPHRDDFKLTPKGWERSPTEAEKAYQGEIRRRWRALLLIIKAKLEAVDGKISTIEREFLVDIVVPASGMTFGEHAAPELAKQYRNLQAPELLPGRS